MGGGRYKKKIIIGPIHVGEAVMYSTEEHQLQSQAVWVQTAAHYWLAV